MKFVFSVALIFAFVLTGFSQEQPEPLPTTPVILSITDAPAKTGENAEALKIRYRGIESALKGGHYFSIIEFTKAIEIDLKLADAYHRLGVFQLGRR